MPDSVLAQLDLPEDLSLAQSSANSFGMPSSEPSAWIEDLIKARTCLLPGQIVIASIVGTAESPADDLVKDFVDCGLRAAEAHPHAIEVNFSCPNVYGDEGSLCNNPEKAGEICRLLAAQIKIPILAKICYLPNGRLKELFLAIYRHVSGFTAINTIPSLILGDGQRPEQMFSGDKRARAGVSGRAIREYATSAARSLAELTQQHRKDLENIGVGGICCADDVKARMETGVRVTQLCTAVNLNPLLGQQIRQQLAGSEVSQPRARFDGETVTFSDATVKASFKVTSEVCNELGVPFDKGLTALRRHFLDRYERERGALHPVKSAARGKAPTKDEIEQWIRFEVTQSGHR